jgi:hypothetical protein
LRLTVRDTMQLTLLKYQGDKHLVTCLARAFGKRRSLTDNGKILPVHQAFMDI